ncbi:hypothetical protein O9G_000436 [Rozella allomycis CSF55]|uniref:RCK N-terminal domain-containing protein n=1 Tax=Rozella allomycis (strain CSF55) TaxID=988480 RepID=A0A075ATP9_ROZAC|nr:hypothetical protein O9G_000436 [Rozella allomycis CSF55]|eukprot:EPZ33661.1 hypothetical protein O9G_000436 [Rozella allomycis CSF55]
MYLNNKRERFYVSWPTIVSLMTLLSPTLAFVDVSLRDSFMSGGYYVYTYPFRFIRLYQNVGRKSLKLYLNILFILLIASGLLHIVETKQQHIDKSFFDVFWYVTGLILIPVTVSDLLDLIRKKSKYVHRYKGQKGDEHVIVIGEFDTNSITGLLKEFFCLDHGDSTINTKLVLINQDEPSEAVAQLIQDPLYMNRVQYIKGSPLSFRVLKKAQADKAKACFVFTGKFQVNKDGFEDSSSVMRTLAVKKYNPNISVIAQVISPTNKDHVSLLAQQVICINEIRFGLLSNNVLSPGVSSLIQLLTTSITDQAMQIATTKIESKPGMNWMKEFLKGATQEFYQTYLSIYFIGKSFLQAAEIIKVKFNVVLIGVSIKSDSNIRSLYLNPQNYLIQGNEIAIIIGCNQHVVSKLSEYSPDGTENSILEESFDHILSESNPIKIFDTPNLNKNYHKRSKSAFVRRNSTIKNDLYYKFTPDSNIFKKLFSDSESLIEIPASINNHVLLCDSSDEFPSNLDCFIGPLRGHHLEFMTPIVILSKTEPSNKVKKYLSNFKNIWFVNGSPLEKADLIRAGIERASRVVILANPKDYENLHLRVADSRTLFAILNAEAMSPQTTFIMAEILHAENAKFLGDNDDLSIKEHFIGQDMLSSAFMGGHVSSPWIMDTLLCQAYYNPYLISILHNLLFSGTKEYNPSDPILPSHLYQVLIPKELYMLNYTTIFRYFLKRKSAICIGVYKLIHDKMIVIPNPKQNTLLNQGDSVFVISHRKPSFE